MPNLGIYSILATKDLRRSMNEKIPIGCVVHHGNDRVPDSKTRFIVLSLDETAKRAKVESIDQNGSSLGECTLEYGIECEFVSARLHW